MKKSIEFAFANPLSSKKFVKAHAQEMSDEVIQKHIKLYVNNYSLDLELKGKKAIELMFEQACRAKLIYKPLHSVFVPNNNVGTDIM